MGLFDPAVLGPAAGTPSATAHVRRRPRLAGHQRRLSRGHGHMARADRIWLLSAAAAFLYLASRKSRWPQSMPCWRVWLPADLGFFLGVYLIAATACGIEPRARRPRRVRDRGYRDDGAPNESRGAWRFSCLWHIHFYLPARNGNREFSTSRLSGSARQIGLGCFASAHGSGEFEVRHEQKKATRRQYWAYR